MIPQKEFARRRQRLMDLMVPNSIAIVATGTEVTRSRDTHYPFRPDSDFHYLSGFGEPEAVLALVPDREQGKYVLFVRDRDRTREIWDGLRAGPEGACRDYGADDAFPIGDIDDILPGLIEGRERVYYAMGINAEFDRRLMGWVNSIRARARSGATPPGEFVDLDHMLHDLRLIKTSAELKVMRKAGEISARAHCRAMDICRPGLFEYQLQAEIEYEFARSGAHWPAYSTIVGSGANGCILHYIENSAKMRNGDLVLIDAGCELDFYAADITRTFPVNGSFSGEQRALYEVVLAAQHAAIDATRAGRHWDEPHEAAVRVLTEGLIELGLLKGERDELIASGAYREFYMHRTGHWLGMDVHDVGDYKVDNEWRLLEPGMVMTVEPGLYVASDNTGVDERWRGIGIRIEDDVAITADGIEILTGGVPKTVDDIEHLMAGS